jgi:DNA-binding MarR family transcriptional regulator
MATHAKRAPLTKLAARSPDRKRGSRRSKDRDGRISELIWDIFAISHQLSAVRQVFASMLDVTGPQWLVLTAVDYLDTGNGVSVGSVSAKLHVNQTFVGVQTKILETAGLLRRESSDEDARVVLLSLTESARQQLGTIAPQRKASNTFIFSQLDDVALKDLLDTISSVRTRLEQAALELQLINKKDQLALKSASA